MKTLRFNCPSCQQSIEAAPETTGQSIACPTCGQFLVPAIMSGPTTKLRWFAAICLSLLLIIAVVEAAFLKGERAAKSKVLSQCRDLAKQVEETRQATQIALATKEQSTYTHLLDWMDYVHMREMDILVGALRTQLRGEDVDKQKAALMSELYSRTFAGMSNAFKPLPKDGTLVRGRVAEVCAHDVTVECDRDDNVAGQLQVFSYANRVAYVGGRSTQFGYCALRTEKKDEFGLSGRVDVIGDALEFVTFTNRLGEVGQMPSYRPRK